MLNLSSFFFFFSTLLISYLILYRIPIVNKFNNYLFRNLSNNAFPAISDFEFNKFSLLRIFFGIIIFVRGIYINEMLLPDEAELIFLSFLILLGAFFLIIGFFTQWVLIFFVFYMWSFGDVLLQKVTLGDSVASMVAVLLFSLNAGKHLSLDSIFLNRFKIPYQFLLYFKGKLTREYIFFAKLSAIICFWALCMHSVSMHINESGWMDGSTGPLLLSSSFMSRWGPEFTYIFGLNEFFVLGAKISIWIMMFWYPSILPFVLIGGILRSYTIIWGWLFIILSLTVLQLGYLAEIEIILWLALFWTSSGMNPKNRLEVIYDDQCNLCDRIIKIVTFLDIFGMIELKPISKNKLYLTKINLKKEDALSDLYGLRMSDGLLFSGYNFYYQLSKTLVLLWPFSVIIYTGKAFSIGPKVYSYIAKRRRTLFGVCSLPSKKYSHSNNVENSSSNFSMIIFIHSSFLAICYLLATPIPYMGWSGINNKGVKPALTYGMIPINVFNAADLKMSENWFTINSTTFNELVPLLDHDGSRLYMHRSDRIYFGGTLLLRRHFINDASCAIGKYQLSGEYEYMEYFSKVYLNLKNAPSGSYDFKYKQFQQLLPDSREIQKNNFKKNDTKLICEIDFKINHGWVFF